MVVSGLVLIVSGENASLSLAPFGHEYINNHADVHCTHTHTLRHSSHIPHCASLSPPGLEIETASELERPPEIVKS